VLLNSPGYTAAVTRLGTKKQGQRGCVILHGGKKREDATTAKEGAWRLGVEIDRVEGRVGQGGSPWEQVT